MVEFLQFINLIGRIAALLQNHEVAVWMTELENSVDALEQAKTSDDKIKSLHGLMGSLSSLG